MSKARINLKAIRQFLSRFKFDKQAAQSTWRKPQADETQETKSLLSPQAEKPFISIVPLGMTPEDLFQQLQQAIAQTFHLGTQVSSPLELSFAFDSSRNQYNSTTILTRLLENPPQGAFKILGVADIDLFIPILTFVFGEAQLNGSAAVVSMYRMRNERYGLPGDERVLHSRFIKEALHELGHTFGLSHCSDDECVMHTSTYVEEIDLKSDGFCPSCYYLISSVLSDKKRDLANGMQTLRG